MFFKRTDHRETEEFKNCRLAVLSVFKQAFSRIQQEQTGIVNKPLSYVTIEDKAVLQRIVECDKAMKDLYQEYRSLFEGIKKFDYSEKERYFERAINSSLRMLTKEAVKTISSVSSTSTTTITAKKSYQGKTSEELYNEYINS